MAGTRLKWLKLLLLPLLFAFLYVASFVVVVLRGYEPGWNMPPTIGFRYSWDERSYRTMRRFYFPVYKATQLFVPIVALPPPNSPSPEEKKEHGIK